jgi:hypothetical protein
MFTIQFLPEGVPNGLVSSDNPSGSIESADAQLAPSQEGLGSLQMV